jgi:conjugal transfer pilus assembly protein TraV
LQPLDASDRAAASSERHAATPAAPPGNAPAGDRVASQSATAPAPATTASQPLRSPPRVLRLWIAPWEDSDGDLHEASTVNVLIDHGRWLVERVRPTPRAPRMGVTTPPATSPAPTTPNGTAPAIGPRTSPALTNPNLDQPEP